jgi:hypothetical protein
VTLERAREVARSHGCEVVTRHFVADVARMQGDLFRLNQENGRLLRLLWKYRHRRRWWW